MFNASGTIIHIFIQNAFPPCSYTFDCSFSRLSEFQHFATCQTIQNDINNNDNNDDDDDDDDYDDDDDNICVLSKSRKRKNDNGETVRPTAFHPENEQ